MYRLLPMYGCVCEHMLCLIRIKCMIMSTISSQAYFGGDHSVTVMAGLTLGDVNAFLIANKLQIPTAPTVISATIGGIIGTASHVSFYGHNTTLMHS